MHFFEIKDNGIGMSPEYHSKVFNMFKRLNHRGVYGGSGLGLSITQKLVKKLNGEISILHSQENQGSTFQISFPDFSESVHELTDMYSEY